LRCCNRQHRYTFLCFHWCNRIVSETVMEFCGWVYWSVLREESHEISFINIWLFRMIRNTSIWSPSKEEVFRPFRLTFRSWSSGFVLIVHDVERCGQCWLHETIDDYLWSCLIRLKNTHSAKETGGGSLIIGRWTVRVYWKCVFLYRNLLSKVISAGSQHAKMVGGVGQVPSCS
jgi:hypothetical protein